MKKGIFFCIVQSNPWLQIFLCTVSIEKRPKQPVDVYQTQQSIKLSVSARIHLFLAQCSLLISNSQSTRFCQSQKHNKTCLLVPNRAFRATADSTNLRNIEKRAFQHEIAHFMSNRQQSSCIVGGSSTVYKPQLHSKMGVSARIHSFLEQFLAPLISANLRNIKLSVFQLQIERFGQLLTPILFTNLRNIFKKTCLLA